MAKKRVAAKENDTSPALQTGIQKSGERLSADLLFFKSDIPLKSKLGKAYGYWGTYPLQKEVLIDSEKFETSDEGLLSQIYLLQCKLNDVHKSAVDVLTRRAEELEIDSAAIWKAGNYCRELLANKTKKHYSQNREDDMFPNCFGESMYELPADIRQAIQDGHAQVLRLGIKNSATKSEFSADRDRFNFYEARKAEKPSLTYKQAASLWEQANNGEPCDEGPFKQSVWRIRNARKK